MPSVEAVFNWAVVLSWEVVSELDVVNRISIVVAENTINNVICSDLNIRWNKCPACWTKTAFLEKYSTGLIFDPLGRA